MVIKLQTKRRAMREELWILLLAMVASSLPEWIRMRGTGIAGEGDEKKWI